jgi:hypothetical protein
MDDTNTVIGTTKNGKVVTEGNVDSVVDDLFSKLEVGQATVESRPRDYYGVTIPLEKLPAELRKALDCV